MSEAAKIYHAIFRERIPTSIEEHWSSIPESVFAWTSDANRKNHEKLVANAGDLEALEFASRVRGRNRLLTLRFQLMVYIAECHPECRRHLINDRDHFFLRSACMLSANALRGVYKLMKGLWLLKRHGGQ